MLDTVPFSLWNGHRKTDPLNGNLSQYKGTNRISKYFCGIIFALSMTFVKWYFSGINRSEEKYFRFCCVHGKVKVVRNQVYRRSKVVLGVLRVLSTLVVGFSVKKGPILLLKLRKVIVFFCELRKTLFSVLTRKKRTFLLHQEMGPFLLNTQQHRWTTLAHQELPCSCDKLDFWQPLLLHGRSNSGNIFSLDL